MNKLSKKIIHITALTAAMFVFCASFIHGIPSFASGTESDNTSSVFTETSHQDEDQQNPESQDVSSEEGSSQNESSQNTSSQGNTSSVTTDQGNKQKIAELVRQYSARIKAALDELESHARAMIAAGNAGDRKKYDSELKAYEDAESKVGRAINSSDGIPYDDAAPIADKAYERVISIDKLCEQAEIALANSLGSAMDEEGNMYSISKVNVKVSRVGKSDDMYDAALMAVGPGSNEKENQLVYRISLFIGKKPVHLIGDNTKSVTIGIPGDKIGRTPVTAYYIWDGGDGNQGAPVAEKRGYFDKSTCCLTVKVKKYVTYYVVCGRPGTKKEVYGDDAIAIQGNKQQLTADELREMLSVVSLEDGNDKKAKALEAVKAEGKATAVYEITFPEDVTLLSDTEAIAEIVCPEAANKAVEVYKITEDNEAEWVNSFLTDDEGKLQLTTDSPGVFVLCWQEPKEDDVPVVVTPTDTVPEEHSSPVLLIVLGIVAAAAAIGGTAFFVMRFLKKK